METVKDILEWAHENEKHILGGNNRTLSILVNKFLMHIDELERNNRAEKPTADAETTDDGLKSY